MKAAKAAAWLQANVIGVCGPLVGMELVDITNPIPDDAPPAVVTYREALRYCAAVAVAQQDLVIAELEELVGKVRQEGQQSTCDVLGRGRMARSC